MRTPGVGCRTFLRLLESHTPAQLFAESSAALSALGLKSDIVNAIKNPDWSLIDYDLDWLSQPNNTVITLSDASYPAQLKEIADPPPLLFVRGNPELLSLPQIAIVGSRNPSTSGLDIAFNFAKTLSHCGFTITSGLALGIDAASHLGALKAQGYTIAVAGTGLDRVYPAKHKDLATEIVNTGAMISEFPPGTTAKANHFPRRNRIISGLCQGLLVVEAAKQSGSLITARMALEQNREVFAIPGSIHNPLARGCNALIREGAKLIVSAADILDEFGIVYQDEARQRQDVTEGEKALLELLEEAHSVDEMKRKLEMQTAEILATLSLLELKGLVRSLGVDIYQKV